MEWGKKEWGNTENIHCAASEQKGYTPMILEDMEVLAALIRHSLPRSSVPMVRFSLIYRTASLSDYRKKEALTQCTQWKWIYSEDYFHTKKPGQKFMWGTQSMQFFFSVGVLLASQTISTDNRCGVDLLLHQLVCAFQQLCRQNHLNGWISKKIQIILQQELPFLNTLLSHLLWTIVPSFHLGQQIFSCKPLQPLKDSFSFLLA